MNTILKDVLKKEVKLNMNTESDYRRSLELTPLKLVSRQSTIISDSNPINYVILLLITLMEPTFACVEKFMFEDSYDDKIENLEYIKLASILCGYLSSAYFLIIFGFARDRFPRFKKHEKVLVSIGLMASIVISFLNINLNGRYTLFRIFPIIAIKSYLLAQLKIPEIFVLSLVGVITAYGVAIETVFEFQHIFLDYIQSGVYYLLFLVTVLYIKKKDAQPLIKQIERPGECWKPNDIHQMFDLMNDGVILIESGCLAYSNASFRRIFREKENGQKGSNSSLESVDEKENNFFMRRFSRVKNIRARNILLQNQLKDLLKNDPIIQKDQNSSKTITRHIDSPDLLLHSEREPTLLNLFISFNSNDQYFKRNGICFNPNTQHPSFEEFHGVLDHSPINFQVGYVESSQKSYLCLVFQNNEFHRDNQELSKEVEAYKKIPPYVAHEMRNPLGAAQAYLEVAQGETPVESDLNTKCLAPCIKLIQYSLTLANDLIDAAQISTGKFKVNYESFFLKELLDHLMGMFDFKAKAKGVQIVYSIDTRLPVEVYTDPGRLSQVLINLVSNSLKYTSKKGMIMIRAESNVLNPRKIEFYVEDTGLGIRPEDQQSLLSDWAKVDHVEDARMNPYGAGLGLSISDKIVRQLSMDSNQEGIKIESVFGKGTKMRFSIENKKGDSSLFPRNPKNLFVVTKVSEKESSENFSSGVDEKHALQETNKRGRESRESGSKKVIKTMTLLRNLNNHHDKPACFCPKVMVIDDDYFSGNSLLSLLKSMKIEAEFYLNFDEALEKLRVKQTIGIPCKRCQRYSVIFMDGLMDGVDGFEATKIIREKIEKKEVRESNIIFCTGLGEEEESKAKSAGASFFLTKPIPKARLRNILSQLGFEVIPRSP